MAPRTTAGVEGLGPTTVNIAERESSGCSDGSAFPADAAAAANKNKRGGRPEPVTSCFSYSFFVHFCVELCSERICN